jgi:HEAT repeat protein
MTCAEVQAMLPEFVDDTLDSSLKSDVDRHLLTCPECSRESSDLRKLFTAMEHNRPVRPSIALKDNFLAMLQAETAAVEASKRREARSSARVVTWFSALGKVAVAAAILLVGMLIGYRARWGSQAASSTEIADLKNAVKDVKETLMINMLGNESASERIKAVNYAEEIPAPNQRVITALVGALNNDKSVNVRLAALYSLARYNDNRAVTDSLVSSLSRQTEPIIQIVLINILGERKEPKAIQPMRNLLDNQKTLKEVKDMARKELNKL